MIRIPSSVKVLWGFNNCRALESVELFEGLIEIRNEAFYGCSSLREITIPSTVEKIGEYAFSGCTSLAVVNIPENTSLGNNGVGLTAFRNVPNKKAAQLKKGGQKTLCVFCNIKNPSFDGFLIPPPW